jgi:acyl-CoA thioesterase-2
MGDFEVDTAIEGEAGRYHAVLSEDWDIWGPNGGYLATIALRAAGREAQVQRPSSFSAHFLSVARFAPVDVEVEVLRRGRSTESFRVSVSQQGKPIIVAMVRTAAEGPGLEHDVARAPEVPDPETLASTEELRDPEWGAPYPFWQNLEARPVHPERFKEPPQPRPPTFREWYRFRPRATFEDPFVDAGRQLLLIDTLSWPAACQPHPNAAFRAPNLDVTTWFHRADPKGEWLLADHESHVAAGALMGTTARVWSREGRLLASGGAHLFCVPAPPEGRPPAPAGMD